MKFSVLMLTLALLLCGCGAKEVPVQEETTAPVAEVEAAAPVEEEVPPAVEETPEEKPTEEPAAPAEEEKTEAEAPAEEARPVEEEQPAPTEEPATLAETVTPTEEPAETPAKEETPVKAETPAKEETTAKEEAPKEEKKTEKTEEKKDDKKEEQKEEQKEEKSAETMPKEAVEKEAAAMAEPPAPAVPVVLKAKASGSKEERSSDAVIDYSNTKDGYVMVKYTAKSSKRLKVRVVGPNTTYTYNLPAGQWTVFPLSDGNGNYSVTIYRNVSGDQYATVLSTSMKVSLKDQFAPFLRPNQYVDYSVAPNTVDKGAQLCAGVSDPLQKVAVIYDYVVDHLSYDYNRAANVKSGYLPVLDSVLAQKKGICFDYAALMTAMLRSQQVPCKLVVGYAGGAYHAWINVWTKENGWVDGAIFFNGQSWKRMDPTYASSSGRSQEIMNFIENGNYSAKYLY